MFKVKLQDYVSLIEEYISELPLNEPQICQSMSYSLAGGGKRIRPVLSLAVAEMLGANLKNLLPAACALELIHTYSLIHDDLPAMDDDDFRRGRLANHKVYGEAYAILAGDGLLTYAFEILARPIDVSAEKQLQVIREVANAAGFEGMVGGQALDINVEDRQLSLDEIETIHRLKTGALLVAAVRLGAILSNAQESELQALTNYARAIGLAFQIKDDILDIEGDTMTLGKPAGSDLKLGKSTFPSLLGLEGAKARLQDQLDIALESISLFGEKAQFLIDLANYIAYREN